jgi:alcohol dehydrogenase class IV
LKFESGRVLEKTSAAPQTLPSKSRKPLWRVWMNEQTRYIGTQGLSFLRKHIAEIKPQNLLLVTGQASFKNAPYHQELQSILKNTQVLHHAGIRPNPDTVSLSQTIALLKSKSWDIVLAVGGGSVLDSAKIINFFCHHHQTVDEYFRSKESPRQKAPYFIAIPTTSGTGSEATQFATLYKDKKKLSLDHETVRPDCAIIDSVFSDSLPSLQTAITGVDALAQAVESFWSIRSTKESEKLAIRSIQLIHENLACAVKNPSRQNRIAMAEASYLAGQAIQITRTTAAHAISYPLTANFGIPHGQAVSLTLPDLLVFNSRVGNEDCLDTRGSQFVQYQVARICQSFGLEDSQQTARKLKGWFKDIGLKTSLSEFGIIESELSFITEQSFAPERMANNPRRITAENLRELLGAIL